MRREAAAKAVRMRDRNTDRNTMKYDEPNPSNFCEDSTVSTGFAEASDLSPPCRLHLFPYIRG